MPFELLEVTARVFEPGDMMTYSYLFHREDDLWTFANPDADCVWDALDNPDLQRGEVGKFVSQAVHFEFNPIANPDAYDGDEAPSLMSVKRDGSIFSRDFLHYRDELNAIAQRHMLPGRTHIAFVLVFEVDVTESTNWSGTVDVEVEAKLLGELDFARLNLALVEAVQE